MNINYVSSISKTIITITLPLFTLCEYTQECNYIIPLIPVIPRLYTPTPYTVDFPFGK